MPRLSLWQWIVAILFLFFYGFAVFAITRDYYLRRPAPPDAVSAPQAEQSGRARTWLEEQMGGPEPDPDAALRSDDPRRLDQVADRLFAEGDYAAAVPLYRRLLELRPADVEARNDLGLALHYTGRSGEALRVLQAGVETEPEHQRIWLTLGFVRAATGASEGARQALERARALDPQTPVGEEAERLLSSLGSG